MYDAESLLDIHERAHRNHAALLAHCRGFDTASIDRELEGFGYPTIRLQLIHGIGAELYWISVLEGKMDARDRDDEFRTVESIEGWRLEVAEATRRYLRSATTDRLNTPAPFVTWGAGERVLMPARVVMRTVTHLYHHQGQVVAMSRLLGRPASGLDFPIG